MILKVMLLGAQNSGKTQLMQQLWGHPFKTDYRETIGTDVLTLNGEQNHKLQLWEVGGNERYLPLRPMYIKGAHIICYCVDLSSEIDLTLMQRDLKQALSIEPGAQVILLGTKGDCCKNSEEKLAAVHLEGITFQHRMVTSAKDRVGVNREDNSLVQVLWKTLTALLHRVEVHTQRVNSFPKSYQQIWSRRGDQSNAVRLLLKDYSKIAHAPGFFESLASSAKLFFAGRWNRHHHQAVLATFTLKNINANTEELLEALKTNLIAQGNTVNPEGSLARRLAFIELQTGHGINIQELNQTILNNKDQKSSCCFG
ncbi:DUF5617 domain-containing protein [Legionella jordanis]|uniref:DUF5617 domain-containing protein n=1 Tax=Legionella jordanis TaxID=456 RepID=UPI0007D066F0|nr:DUF5617 domain-containing protein [Legionella jordanis]RMX01873.1 GTP-binding protein [Legionella jordanis]RMX17663.1 GTP-binding protein [Legionella jordanis]VEH11624.1 Rho GTPase (Miro-like) [Legionella jordanis]